MVKVSPANVLSPSHSCNVPHKVLKMHYCGPCASYLHIHKLHVMGMIMSTNRFFLKISTTSFFVCRFLWVRFGKYAYISGNFVRSQNGGSRSTCTKISNMKSTLLPWQPGGPFHKTNVSLSPMATKTTYDLKCT